MIIDLQSFLAAERPAWEELEAILDRLDRKVRRSMSLEEVQRFHYLYEKVSADLGRIATFTSEQQTRRYLESLVARAYGEIHEVRGTARHFRPWHWMIETFPCTFRRHIRAFQLAVAVTLVGSLFGGLVMTFDPASKDIVIPGFDHLTRSPTERVQQEEKRTGDHLQGVKVQGAAWYMTHNTQVAINTMALGITYGIGTVIMLFSTGVMIGGIIMDYVIDGQSEFLVAWLLPHGAFEIPAILLAGQAGFLIAGALIGWGRRIPLRERFRRVSRDLTTLIVGVALFLVWAGIIEAFLSQYHEPFLPYWAKIAFGSVELIALILYLSLAGRGTARKTGTTPEGTEALAP